MGSAGRLHVKIKTSEETSVSSPARAGPRTRGCVQAHGENSTPSEWSAEDEASPVAELDRLDRFDKVAIKPWCLVIVAT